MKAITIDVGTTNTRVRYVENEEILSEVKEKVGVRDTAITGSLNKLKVALKNGIERCLQSLGKTLEDVDKIIASGMITSNLGLIEMPHVAAPVGMKDLSLKIAARTFQDIVDKPIYFIPGVKNKVQNCSIDNLDQMDMMRGEEVESLGALYLSKIDGNVIFISPGSHTKFVFINKEQQIEKCSTTLTGELLWALSKETILASSIPKELMTSIDKEYIHHGIKMVQKHGFSKTCFLVRIMDTFLEATPNQRANFIAGAISFYDIQSVQKDLEDKKPQILIGGNKILRNLYAAVLDITGYDMKKVKLLGDEENNKAAAIGAIKIIEKLQK